MSYHMFPSNTLKHKYEVLKIESRKLSHFCKWKVFLKIAFSNPGLFDFKLLTFFSFLLVDEMMKLEIKLEVCFV